MAEYIVAIDVTRVRFPADALICYTSLVFFLVGGGHEVERPVARIANGCVLCVWLREAKKHAFSIGSEQKVCPSKIIKAKPMMEVGECITEVQPFEHVNELHES